MSYDMNISGQKTGASGFDCFVTGYKRDGYLVTLSTFTSKSNRDNLIDWIKPGKYEQWDVLAEDPYYIDTTYSSGNTLLISTSEDFNNFWTGSKLVIKEYKEEPYGRPPTDYSITLSGYIYTSL